MKRESWIAAASDILSTSSHGPGVSRECSVGGIGVRVWGGLYELRYSWQMRNAVVANYHPLNWTSLDLWSQVHRTYYSLINHQCVCWINAWILPYSLYCVVRTKLALSYKEDLRSLQAFSIQIILTIFSWFPVTPRPYTRRSSLACISGIAL